MQFRLLGQVEIEAAGEILPLPQRRSRCLLAILLLDVNRPVPVDRLARLLWDDDPPERARGNIQGLVSRLRAALARAGDDRVEVEFSGDGYRIDADPQTVDAHRFQSLLDSAATTADLAERVDRLRAALDLWRGPALGNAASDWLRDRLCADLEERRLAAVEDLVSASLLLRREREIMPVLVQTAAAHPGRESLTELHMRALYQANRKTDALEVYTRARAYLGDELGLDPGPKLRDLHQAILRDQLRVPTPPATSPIPPPRATVPRQLPAPPQMFTGRAGELADLDRIDDSSTVVVTAMDGMAGVGKSALAIHWAHQVADQYPDGQVFTDLHGFTKAVTPVAPGVALERMLRALGVAGERIPDGLDERAALWRTTIAGRRMLIVLDNAATQEQVTPLLPGTPGCLVLVTSRRRLSGLDATGTVSLDTLPPADALTLFARTAGQDRVADQPGELVAETVELCDRLPLAIRIAAARLRSHPTWSVADLAARLRGHDQRLAELDDGARGVTAALDLSYQQLTGEQQRLYRLLGLHPGPDLDPYAAAALADAPVARARGLLDRLLDAHLLHEPVPGRYTFHDLVRAHAAATATRDEPEPDLRAALTRLLDHYRHTAAVAMDTAYPYEPERRPRVPPAATPTPDLSDATRATGWLDTELPNLLAAAQHAADHDWPEHTWHLSATLHRHLRTRGRYTDAETLHHQALATARAIGNRTGEIDALTGIGHVHVRQGRHRQATDHFERAFQLARVAGHRAGEAEALIRLGTLHLRQDRYQRAHDHFGQALHIARAAGHLAGELEALIGIGHVHLRQGRHEQAIDHYQRAVQLARATGNHIEAQSALTGLAFVSLRHGKHDQALDHFRQALDTARAIGHRVGEQHALAGLGDVQRKQGRYQPAIECYQQSLDLARELGDRNWQFEAVHGLGRIHQATGQPETALSHHRQALALATDLHQRSDQARAHDGLAHTYHALDQHDQARHHWQQALDILTSLGLDHTEDPEANPAAIRTHLADLDQPQAPSGRDGPEPSGS